MLSAPTLMLVQSQTSSAIHFILPKDGHLAAHCHSEAVSAVPSAVYTFATFHSSKSPPQNINIPPVASSSANIDEKLFGEGNQPLDCQCNEECANQIGKVELGVQGSFSFFIISRTDLATLKISLEFDSRISSSAIGFARYRMFSSVIKGNFNFESV